MSRNIAEEITELEERYIVIKITDAIKYLPPVQRDQLVNIQKFIDTGRNKDGKYGVVAVVIEQDWPEYAGVVAKLLCRINRACVEKLFPNSK